MMGDSRAIAALVMALKDGNSGVRRIASASLTRIDQKWSSSPEGRAALEDLKPALKDKDPDVRHFVGHLLSGVGTTPPTAPSAKEDELPGLDAQERRRKLAVGLFLAVLCDTDKDLRQAAAEALGLLGGSRAQAGLLRVVADPDPDVRHAAEKSLRGLAQVSGIGHFGNGAAGQAPKRD
jgi:hypothetical protein